MAKPRHPAILEYERLKHAKLRSEHPTSTDEEYRRRFSMFEKYIKPKKATQLEKIIVEYLHLLGHSASKVSIMGVYRDNTKVNVDSMGCSRTIGSGQWTKGNARKGFSDIDSVVHSLSLKIEVKWKKDVMSPEQKKFRDDTVRAGGFYMLAHTFEQFYDDFQIILEHPKMIIMRQFDS